MVYISRYFIHEIIFVFFQSRFVVASCRSSSGAKPGFSRLRGRLCLLLVCFLPSALNLARYIGKTEQAIWSFALAFFLVEAALCFFVLECCSNGRGQTDLFDSRVCVRRSAFCD
jgi:hypothetical protein